MTEPIKVPERGGAIQRWKLGCEDFGDRYSDYRGVLRKDAKGTVVKYVHHAKILRERDERIVALGKALKKLLYHMNDSTVTMEKAETEFEKAMVQARTALEAK